MKNSIVMKSIMVIISVFICFYSNAQNPVSLDSTFGVSGKMVTTINPDGHIRNKLHTLRQTDGKFVGSSTFGGYPVLTRYDVNGNLDSTWGLNGISEVYDTIDNNLIFGITELDNGQILLAGVRDYNIGNGEPDNYIIKFKTDGSVDSTFGVNGIVHHTQLNPGNFSLRSFIVMDSSIYLTGTIVNLQAHGVISFDLQTGSLNSGFGTNGFKQINLNGYFGGNFHCELYNNKIRAYFSTRFYQLTSDFEVDISSTFGNNGFIELPCGLGIGVNTGFAHGPDGFSSIIHRRTELLNDGSFLVAGIGYSCPAMNKQGMVVKYSSDGSIDSSFANNGSFVVDFRRDSSESNYINSVKMIDDNYFLVSGGVYQNTFEPSTGKVSKRFAMALFDDNGNPVSSFGNLGHVYRESYFHSSDSLDWLANSFIQQDGKVVLMGFTPHYDPYDFQTNGTGFGAIDNISSNLSRYTIQGISEGGGVGVNQETKNNFTIYPNPTNSILNIQSDKVIQKVSIYNYLGELVIQENGQAINQINVEQLNKGIYVIRMTGKESNVFNGKFVKE